LKLSTHFIRPVLVFHDEPVVEPIQGTAIQLARYIGHRTTHAKKVLTAEGPLQRRCRGNSPCDAAWRGRGSER
jgi:hypothetical protein